MEFIAILVVLIGGFGFLAVRRHWLERRDASLTETAGGDWRIRSELPLDAGPPYADFAPDLFLLMPSDVMEGTDEGFDVAYFTVEDGGRNRGRIQRPAAIVQVPIETPRFRYLAEDLDDDAAQSLAAFQQQTPPHYDSGTAGRIGPKTAELLSRARSVIVETATFAVFIRSKGATSREVNRLALELAKAMVADARAPGGSSGGAGTSGER